MANAIKSFFPVAFRERWLALEPSWTAATRIQVFPARFQPPPKVDGDRVPWLSLLAMELPGDRKAVNGLDVAIYLLTVELFVPIPEIQATAVELYAQKIKRAFQQIDWPDGAMQLGPPRYEDVQAITEDYHLKGRCRQELEVQELELHEVL